MFYIVCVSYILFVGQIWYCEYCDCYEIEEGRSSIQHVILEHMPYIGNICLCGLSTVHLLDHFRYTHIIYYYVCVYCDFVTPSMSVMGIHALEHVHE